MRLKAVEISQDHEKTEMIDFRNYLCHIVVNNSRFSWCTVYLCKASQNVYPYSICIFLVFCSNTEFGIKFKDPLICITLSS